MASIGTLTANLALESVAFIRDMTRAQRAVASNTAQMRRDMQKVERATRNVQRQFGQMRNAAAALAGVLAVRQFAKFTASAIAAGDALAKQSRQLQISATALQRYRIEGDLAGVATEKLEGGIGAFVKRVGELRAETGTLITILDKSNVALKEQLLAATSSEEGIAIMLAAIRDAGSAFDKQALAAAAFGRQAGQAMVLLAESAGTLDAEMVRLVTRSDNMLAASERLNDEFTLLRSAFSAGFDTALVEGLAGSIDASAEAMREARRTGEEFGRAVGLAMRGLAEAARFVANNMREIVAVLAALAALKAAAVVIGIARAMAALAVAMRAAAISGGLFKAVLAGSKKGLLGIAAAAASAAAVLAVFSEDAEAAVEETKKLLSQFGGGESDVESFTDQVTLSDKEVRKLTSGLQFQTLAAQDMTSALMRSEAEYEAVRTEIEILNEGVAANIDLSSKAGQAWVAAARDVRKAEKRLDDLKRANEEAAAAAKEAAEEQKRVVQQATDDIVSYAGDRFADVFADTEFSWKSMWDSMRKTAKQTLARIAAEAALRPIVTPIVAGLMGGGSGGASGGGGGAGGLFGLLGSGGLSQTINSYGAQVGFANVPSNFVGPLQPGQTRGLTASGFLGGAGAGFGAGMVANGIIGGNATFGALGSGLGAGAGAIIGSVIPGLGTLAGGLIGGALGGVAGGLFGPSKSVGAAGSAVLGVQDGRFITSAVGGDNGFDTGGIRAAADEAVAVLNKLAERFDLQAVVNLPTGARTLASNAALSPGAQTSVPGLVTAILQAGGLAGGNEALNKVFRGSTADTLEENLELLGSIPGLLGPATTAFDDALAAVNDNFRLATRRATEFGLATEKIAAAQAAAIAEVRAQFRTPFAQASGQIVDFLRGQTLSASSSLSPTAKLNEAQRQFADLLGRVRGGEIGLSGSLTQAAGTLLDLGRNNFASSVDFRNLEGFVQSNLLSVADQISSDEFFDAQVEATKQQTAEVVNAQNETTAAIVALRREIQLLKQELAA